MDKQPFIVSIDTSTAKLRKTLKYLKGTFQGKRNIFSSIICDITVTRGKATFAVPGAVFTLDCITLGTCKAAVSYAHLHEIIKDLRVKEIAIIITEGNMKIYNVTIAVKTTFFENDKILRTIRLPINYTVLDLLRLQHQGYTYEELNFNNLTSDFHYSELYLKRCIREATQKLKIFGVKRDDLLQLVNSKIYN